nr:hypothetical protein TIFTF001_039429 [Ficus carica]GMN70387.1 hypothetical protein TIFTF001_039430 [Ficus carica]
MHTVELSRWVSLLSLLEGLVRLVRTILGQLVDLTVVMVPLIGKVPLSLVIVPLTSLRLALISEVSTVMVVIVVLRDLALTKLAFLFLIQMIFSTKGTLDTFSCGGWWSSPTINNHCNLGSQHLDHSPQSFFFI